MPEQTTIKLEVGVDAETDAEEIDALTRSLRHELGGLDFAEVGQVDAAEVPEGAKSGTATTVGSLVVTLVQGAGGVAAVTGIVQAWLGRSRGRTVELEIDGNKIKVTGASSEVEERLIQEWIGSNTYPSAGDER
jgi:Effector Associated Constant Component 1